MRMLRVCAAALALMLAAGAADVAVGEIGPRRRMETPALYRRTEEGRNRDWWGVLYEDAPLLVRAEKGEEPPREETEPVFIWPLWEWLLRFLGFQ